MLEVHVLKENPEAVIQQLAIKNINAKETVYKVLELDEQRRNTQKQLDDTLAESKKIAKEIGQLFKSGQQAQANELKAHTATLKQNAKVFGEKLDMLQSTLHETLLGLPNLPHPSVPAGKSDSDNEILSQEGDLPQLADDALPHWELANKYDIIDFDLGSKVTGAGFPFYKKQGARLQRALINFFIDEAVAAGYDEVQTPLLVNEASGLGTGQLPDKEGQMYHAQLDNLYLIPTAEVPITNMFRNIILKPDQLPVKTTAYSNCFRREAGSYGKDVRGLNRLHQFDKVEVVQVTKPENSYDTLSEMREHVAGILRKLELPFRTLRLCGGDLSFTSALTFDFEVYSAAQKMWLEVSSVSNFETFQSNRMKLRYKDEKGKTRLAHTLNGSALALPRIVAALLENNQCPEGIRIPAALIPYTGFDMIRS